MHYLCQFCKRGGWLCGAVVLTAQLSFTCASRSFPEVHLVLGSGLFKCDRCAFIEREKIEVKGKYRIDDRETEIVGAETSVRHTRGFSTIVDEFVRSG